MTEVKAMIELKRKREYFVEYIDAWIEFNILYIQMELCDCNLKEIIDLKNTLFDGNNSEKYIALNYYISSELFREIIECVQYLHELKTQNNSQRHQTTEYSH